jgi:hypothetical protein
MCEGISPSLPPRRRCNFNLTHAESSRVAAGIGRVNFSLPLVSSHNEQIYLQLPTNIHTRERELVSRNMLIPSTSFSLGSIHLLFVTFTDARLLSTKLFSLFFFHRKRRRKTTQKNSRRQTSCLPTRSTFIKLHFNMNYNTFVRPPRSDDLRAFFLCRPEGFCHGHNSSVIIKASHWR